MGDLWWTEEDESFETGDVTKIVQEMVGRKIRLVSFHWSTNSRKEYLYFPDLGWSSKRGMVLSWKDEVQEDILSKSQFLVEAVPNQEDQIRLISVRWSTNSRKEYLYSPTIDAADERRMVLLWKGKVQEDILSKSRYVVEKVPGKDNQIRLISVHWSTNSHKEYLYSPAIDWSKKRRMFLSWKGDVQKDILSKSRYLISID
ncbi:uncharacterized protein METZ01_LOCUS295569 [marine metagenome]|uniref:Uncharacterized protein n=1 Tax=marine metagenome TaxID=408172 RepID=A0A382M418_9ZZZZ|tara:strand:- start:11 stop:613 length:603 start_codon:yes stop_codon:yes gene_type:complete